jgi:transcriptional regulator with XRE-family HTH domain
LHFPNICTIYANSLEIAITSSYNLRMSEVSKFRMLPGLGERLRVERKRLGLTQDTAAEKLGVSRGTYFGYEKDLFVPSIAFLTTLTDTGFDAHFIVTGNKKLDSHEQLGVTMSDVDKAMGSLRDHLNQDLGTSNAGRVVKLLHAVLVSHATKVVAINSAQATSTRPREKYRKARNVR